MRSIGAASSSYATALMGRATATIGDAKPGHSDEAQRQSKDGEAWAGLRADERRKGMAKQGGARPRPSTDAHWQCSAKPRVGTVELDGALAVYGHSERRRSRARHRQGMEGVAPHGQGTDCVAQRRRSLASLRMGTDERSRGVGLRG